MTRPIGKATYTNGYKEGFRDALALMSQELIRLRVIWDDSAAGKSA